MARLTLILGGARSGKSTYAERLARKHERVIYLATGQVTDEEMADRVRRHQAARPAGWVTVEEALHPAAALRGCLDSNAPAPVVLLDCVTFLISNHLLADEEHCETLVLRELEALLELPVEIIAVSNEVGQGVVPAYKLGRIFRDIQGRANQFLAAHAERVFVCWAGLPVDIKRLAEVDG